MNFSIGLLAALIAFFVGAEAQEVSGRSCRILFLQRPADAPKTLQLFDGTAFQEVALPSMNLSPVYRISPGAVKLRFLTDKVDNPASVSPEAPTVEIPAGDGDFYLLVSSDPQNQIAPVSVQAFLPTPVFKVGQMFWINLTDKTIEGKLGDHPVSIKPTSSKVVEAPIHETGSYQVDLNFQTQADAEGTNHSLCQTQWTHDPNSRFLVLVFSEGKSPPRIMGLSDFRMNP